jgi:hypothetical protein
VKNITYQVKINDLQHLKARIRDAVATVTLNMLQATRNEIEYRLDICRATKETNIETGLHPSTVILKNTRLRKLNLFPSSVKRVGSTYSVVSVRKLTQILNYC